MSPRSTWFIVGAILCIAGCTPNTVYFSERTTFGFNAEFKPDASEPLNSALAYKRRIVAVVPPQYPDVASPSDWLNGRQNVHEGEALSVISAFSVDAKATQGIVIENNFLSGNAARIATAKNPDAVVKSVRSPGTLTVVPADLQRRREALAAALQQMSEPRAGAILNSLGVSAGVGQTAKFTLSKTILAAQDDAAVSNLEDAFKRNP